MDGVGEAGDLSLALLDDGESEDRQIGANDGTTNGLALALTGSAGAVAGVSVVEEKADTGRMKDALPVQRPMLAEFNFFQSSRKLARTNSTYIMGKPCLSFPPVMRTMYPFHSSPRESAGTSWPICFQPSAIPSGCRSVGVNSLASRRKDERGAHPRCR